MKLGKAEFIFFKIGNEEKKKKKNPNLNKFQVILKIDQFFKYIQNIFF